MFERKGKNMEETKVEITPAVWQALQKGDVVNAFIAATPGGIEAQEARGQSDLVASANLPKQGPWIDLAVMGITRGKDIDDLFCEATLPAGWKKVPTDHSMWSDLVDETGKKRAAIFYKAAFYDRRAHLEIVGE